MTFKEVSPQTLNFNPFTRIGSDWMLITAGQPGDMNTMTASWGGAGVLWTKNVVTAYIRPQRYTLEFVEKNDCYSLCFFDEEYRSALNFCGTKSGRDFDKDKETGLTPVFGDIAPYYEQAKLVFLCRKLYRQDMTAESFLQPENLKRWYPQMDLHRMFVGEIVKVLERK